MIRTLVAEGTTVLLTTQYLDEADRLADEIVVIDHGKVIAAGTPQQLKTRIGGQVLQAQPADPADLPATEKILAAFAEGDEGAHNDGQLVSVVDQRPVRPSVRPSGSSTTPGSPWTTCRCGGRASTRCSSRSPATWPRRSGSRTSSKLDR